MTIGNFKYIDLKTMVKSLQNLNVVKGLLQVLQQTIYCMVLVYKSNYYFALPKPPQLLWKRNSWNSVFQLRLKDDSLTKRWWIYDVI